ncbi:RNA polymerase factor sigma-54 [Thalassobacillus sp. CUG 92003]|uniref:RNA polymerase factor sigma-54 n=1 Tax=Thalassobacillus sp. CUG 92003 TaxID=2736641 RepID=UPI0015E71FC6|nr:RNA polymerase factor sigma-54 [Thalassobacillus sp. CUG 92003]
MKLNMETKQTQHVTMTPFLQQAIHLLQLSSSELKAYIEKEALENPWIDLKEPSFTSTDNPNDTPLYQKDQQPDLYEYLLEQTAFLSIHKNEKKMIPRFILHLNEHGYMNDTLEQLAEEYDISLALAERCLTHLQQLDPPGIGASSLKESLLLQAKRVFPGDQKLTRLITDYLQEAAAHKKDDLCKVLRLTPTELNNLLGRLQSLHPKPGLLIGTSRADILVPDIFINAQEGTYSISLNNQIVPKLDMNQEYKHMMKEHKETASFLEEKYNAFLWLKRGIEQRQHTILAITEEVVRQQPTLVSLGTQSLSPLTRKEVADSLEIHESTVSRAVRNKIVETPAGTYDMEALFPSRTRNGSSSAMIKNRIRNLVMNEDPRRPLSDQKLVHLLAEEGCHASRRTIAKYRDSMHILSSSKRKKVQILN